MGKWDTAALQGVCARETSSYPYILASAGATDNDDGAEVVLDGIIIALIIASGVLRLTTSGQQSMGRGLKLYGIPILSPVAHGLRAHGHILHDRGGHNPYIDPVIMQRLAESVEGVKPCVFPIDWRASPASRTKTTSLTMEWPLIVTIIMITLMSMRIMTIARTSILKKFAMTKKGVKTCGFPIG